MALLDFYDKVSRAVDNKEYSIGIFIDLQKAFDTVNHKILLDKLSFYGIRGVTLAWFHSYLANRSQCVYLNNTFSSYGAVVCGVPQGSILGPLLFILYINDIVHCSKVLYFILFADDTNLLYSNVNISELISVVNSELRKLSCWFKSNRLSLNVKKSNFIMFGNKQISNCQINIAIDDAKLERASSLKFLGVHIDGRLTWKTHIAEISKKVSKNVGILNKIKYKVPSESLLTLYHAMIGSHLSYCTIVWGCAKPSVIDSLIKLQKRAVRIITLSKFREHSDPLFFNLGILKISDIYRLQVATFVFNVKFDKFSNSLEIFYRNFQFPDVNKGYITRSACSNLAMPRFRTEIRKNSVLCSGPRIWNYLPTEYKCNQCLHHFNKQLKLLFISKYH
jgi:hypothetical protein